MCVFPFTYFNIKDMCSFITHNIPVLVVVVVVFSIYEGKKQDKNNCSLIIIEVNSLINRDIDINQPYHCVNRALELLFNTMQESVFFLVQE